jgi:hypothetical protein
MKIIKIIALVFLLLLLTLYNLIGLIGRVNHTGTDVKFWAFLSVIFGLILFFITNYFPGLIGRMDRLYKFIIIIAMLSGINILIYDYLNIMVEYEEWLHRGLPKKPFYIG